MAKPRIRTLTQVHLADFAERMNRHALKAVRRSNEGMKEVALVAINSLIDDTPKLTNQAAANWQAAVNYSPDFKPGFTSLEGAKAAAWTAISSRKPGDRINISNLTPYIGLLNRGSSQQAPAMFVESAIERARQRVRKIKILED